MERPERPSRHKLNQVKLPIRRPAFSSDSESELNDNDSSIHITYYQSQPESTSTGGPSTSASSQLLGQSNPDTSSNTINDFSQSSTLLTLSPDESRTEAQTQLNTICRKKTPTSFVFENLNSDYHPTTTVQGVHSPPERSHRSDCTIRPRSFCHINNTNVRAPVLKFRRLHGPIDLTPSTSNRDSSSQAPAAGCSLFGNSISSNSDTTQNCLLKSLPSSSSTYGTPANSESTIRSTLLRHFDELCPATSSVRKRKPSSSYSARSWNPCGEVPVLQTPNNSTLLKRRNYSNLDDYCDLVNNFFFTGSGNDTNSRSRSPERAGTSEQQTSTTADIINRHISTTPDIINHEPTSLINEINSYLDPPQSVRNNIEIPIDPDCIVVETVDGNNDMYIVPSSRSPSPVPRPLPTISTSSSSSKPDKSLSNQIKEVPMTLQDLNQSLVSLLECPVCLDHATPPIYQCCKGHILCRNCHPRLTTCPICRSRLPGDRNSVMEKVAEKLMYPCKNTVTGCSQMLKLDDKQKHEESCGFRHYNCIMGECHWKGYKPEMVVHLQSNHPDKLITGPTKELHVPVPMNVPEDGPMLITHHWIQSAHNEVFIVAFHIDLYKRVMKGCVIYIGGAEKAEKFTYIFELKQQVSPFRKLSYSRITHSDIVKPGQHLHLSNDFSINIDIGRLYHDNVSNTIPVHISIVQNQ